MGAVYEDGTLGASRAAQQQLATGTPNVGFVSADGLVTLDAGTHFNASSQLILGQRFADAMTLVLTAP